MKAFSFAEVGLVSDGVTVNGFCFAGVRFKEYGDRTVCCTFELYVWLVRRSYGKQKLMEAIN